MLELFKADYPTLIIVFLDIIIVSILIYQTLLFVRGTRAVPMLAGLGILLLLYWVSAQFSLVVLNWILGNFLGSVILVIVVLFQDDLRRGLIKVGLIPGLGSQQNYLEENIKAISKAASELSAKKIGALIAIEREIGLEEYIEDAVKLDALLTRQLLVTIFQISTPLHDGAVVVSGNRVLAAGAVLPLSFSSSIPSNFGTRHRAALGMSERTDSVMVVVSEETGSISVVREGRFIRDLSENTLNATLNGLLKIKNKGERRRGYFSFFSKPKLDPLAVNSPVNSQNITDTKS